MLLIIASSLICATSHSGAKTLTNGGELKTHLKRCVQPLSSSGLVDITRVLTADQHYSQIDLEDLHDNQASAGIMLNMQDRQRYFEGRSGQTGQDAVQVHIKLSEKIIVVILINTTIGRCQGGYTGHER